MQGLCWEGGGRAQGSHWVLDAQGQGGGDAGTAGSDGAPMLTKPPVVPAPFDTEKPGSQSPCQLVWPGSDPGSPQPRVPPGTWDVRRRRGQISRQMLSSILPFRSLDVSGAVSALRMALLQTPRPAGCEEEEPVVVPRGLAMGMWEPRAAW